MPAALLWFISIISTLFLSGGVSGIKNMLNPSDVSAHRYVPDGTPGSTPTPAPSTGEIIKDAVNKPSSMWAIGFLAIGGTFLLMQVRAAAHEAGTATVATYNEGKDAIRKASDTRNKSRLKKGGD